MVKHKWLQLKSGSVYGWSSSLAKARGAFPVSDQVAADYFRSKGADSEFTRAHPPGAAPDAADYEVALKPSPRQASLAAKKAKALAAKQALQAASKASKAVQEAAKVETAGPLSPEQVKELIDGTASADS
jgi:hypothetical protein